MKKIIKLNFFNKKSSDCLTSKNLAGFHNEKKKKRTGAIFYFCEKVSFMVCQHLLGHLMPKSVCFFKQS